MVRDPAKKLGAESSSDGMKRGIRYGENDPIGRLERMPR
jgi:hypothetical protein